MVQSAFVSLRRLMHVLRFILALMLAVQPGLCLVGGTCGGTSAPTAHRDCCCGETCPASAESETGSIIQSCDCCSSDQPAQPVAPSKSSNDGRIDYGAPAPSALVAIGVSAIALASKPQVRCAHHSDRSINALLCIWLT